MNLTGIAKSLAGTGIQTKHIFIIRLVFAFAVLTFVLVCCRQRVQAEQPGANHTVSTRPAASNNEDEREIIVLERNSWDLAIKGDADAYRALHTPSFFTVSSQGVTDRRQSEASALDPGVHFDRYDLSNFAVTFVEADAALVTYCVKAAGSDHGRQFLVNSFATSLWVKQNGGWLNAFYQASPAKSQ
jgi:hypothetical protein